VDRARRDDIRRNHTATHLLHKVLKVVLGEHVKQQGSLVAPDRLRFDFSHGKPLAKDELARIEELVSGWILANREAATQVMDLEAAKASGAVAMFGEKYESSVRVLDVPGAPAVGAGSRELCGGTHVARTGDIGAFRIVSEGGIASGVRRIEAVTGRGAALAAAGDRAVLKDLGDLLRARPDELAERVKALQAQLKDFAKAQEKAQAEAAAREVDRLAAANDVLGGLRVTFAALDGLDGKALKGVWERLRSAGVALAVLISRADGKAPVFVGCAEAAQARGLDAGALLKHACQVLGGGGGGKKDQAQGQGQDAGKAVAALDAVRAQVVGVLGA
jgi:alanyl-tRNA synthetase